MSPRKRHVSSPTEPKPPTIKEVAEYAGVSTASVSRVLSGQQVVSDDLIKQVQSAVAALSYRPNRTPRTMRKRENQMIGLVVFDLQDPHSIDVIQGIDTVVGAAGFTTLLCDSNRDSTREMVHLHTLRYQGVAGIILQPSSGTADGLKQFARTGPPMVTLETAIARAPSDTVELDRQAGMELALDYLRSGGRERIALIGGQEIGLIYRAALEKTARNVNESFIRAAGLRADSGYQEMLALLDLTPAPDAVLAGNHLTALGALWALSERGVSVPDGMAVLALDDPAITAPLGITAVDWQSRGMGETAARLLLERIAAPRQPARRQILAPQLVAGKTA